MQLTQTPVSALRPQLHSRRCHHTYNATRLLPRAIWVRSLCLSDPGPDLQDLTTATTTLAAAPVERATVSYEILLYYDHNRACTIYRTPGDVRRLRAAAQPSHHYYHQKQKQQQQQRAAFPPQQEVDEAYVVEDLDVVQAFLCEVMRKRGRDCALEYFLRRRMDDCGGVGGS